MRFIIRFNKTFVEVPLHFGLLFFARTFFLPFSQMLDSVCYNEIDIDNCIN
jgi:hypothetical protein